MAADLALSSVVGTSFELLFHVVRDSVNKNVKFKPLIRELQAKLECLSPLITEINQLNKALDEPAVELEELAAVMKQGIELIQKCSNLSAWNPYKTYKYGRQLIELNESLQKNLDILVIQTARDMKRTMVTAQNNIDSILKAKGTSAALPLLPRFVTGMDKPLSEVRAKLIDDDEVSMLVLTGPGGCGKTTLAIMLCNDQIIKDKFGRNIFFVTVPKTSNAFEVIAEQLYASKGYSVAAMQNKDAAVNLLQQFMTKERNTPLLLVLDDVWPAQECVLETFDDVKMPNLKILITSRSGFPRYGFSYHMKLLDYGSAMALFRHVASVDDGSYHIAEPLIEKIVTQCKGFPLAITCVGRSLYRQPAVKWQSRIIEMSRGSVLDSETELLLSLQGSCDTLETGLKECFIDLGSFPGDHMISVAALLDMWMELYAENQEDEVLFIRNIFELNNRCLVDLTASKKEEMEEDGYYSDKFVTQHDLLRELANYQSKQQPVEHRERLIVEISGDAFPKWWREDKYQPTKARLASFSTDKKFSKNWPKTQLPEAEVLILNFERNDYALPEFVERMLKLKVLIVTNLGSSPVELSDFQLLESLAHIKRIRLEKISMASITKDPIELRSVQKISLYKCDIGQAFPNCPNLEELNIDCCNDLVELPAEIFDLIHLKTLCVTNCENLSALSEENEKLIHLEVLRLRSCTRLKKLPSSLKSLENLSLLDISGCSGIEELPDCFDEMSSLTKINMRQCSSLKELPPSIDLGKLEEVICDEATKRLWEKFLPNPKIRVLQSEVS